MKLFAALLASSEAWSLGSCADEEASGFCRNECSFKWLGRRDKIKFKEMGKHENGFLAQATAFSWQEAHLSKDGYYTGMLRFDRQFCKQPILRAIGAGNVVINVFDRTDGNYAHEAQFYEVPKNGDKSKEAAFVQFRRSGYLNGDMLFKGKDRFFIEMTNIAAHHEPLNPPNDNVSHDDYYMCFNNVGLLHQADEEQEDFYSSDYSKCAAYTRYGQDKDWEDPENPTAPPTTTTTTVETLSGMSLRTHKNDENIWYKCTFRRLGSRRPNSESRSDLRTTRRTLVAFNSLRDRYVYRPLEQESYCRWCYGRRRQLEVDCWT